MSKSSKWLSFHFHLASVVIGFIMIYPILWTFASSLKEEDEIFLHATSLLPGSFDWRNYAEGWAGFGNLGFDAFFLNSAITTSLIVVGTLISSTLVAYGFARMTFPLRTFLFGCLLVTIMLPSQVTLIPQYIIFHQLGWVNTFLPLIVPAFIGGTPFFIFLTIQFMKGIPRELDHAARIDGCGSLGIFLRIILPLMRPVMTTAAIFSFYWAWDDFMTPLIYLNDPKLFTVSLGLKMFSDPYSVSAWGPMLAMSTLSLLPQFIIFLFFQRYLVEGIATTGLKG